MLAIAAGVLAIGPAALTHAGNVTATQTVASESVLPTAHTAVPDATIGPASTHVGQFVTAYRPIVAATALSLLLLPLFFPVRRQPVLPAAVTPRRTCRGTPLRRGPPTFLAR